MRIGRILWRVFLLAIVAVGLLQVWFLAHVMWWQQVPPKQTAFMSSRLSELRANDSDAELHHQWVDYAQISPHLKRAVIASEDSLFTQHQGFDWESLEKAWQRNQRQGRVVLGGSTISQQLAKNLFLSGQRSMLRKGQEAVITVMLEGSMSKRRILEIYLNMIEWGDGVYGAEAAARHYFKKSAAQLTPYEAARLAAMIPRPRFYDRNRYTSSLARKTGVIQRRMRQVSIPR
ncbi:MAG: monofunctional biosynthetic peptidoglycan transglycosylase [Moraxellaceae bacterium]|nr:monofunctional biosynthetic peptidoglycan transglycosylase [Moraxellaceae bacterium]